MTKGNQSCSLSSVCIYIHLFSHKHTQDPTHKGKHYSCILWQKKMIMKTITLLAHPHGAKIQASVLPPGTQQSQPAYLRVSRELPKARWDFLPASSLCLFLCSFPILLNSPTSVCFELARFSASAVPLAATAAGLPSLVVLSSCLQRFLMGSRHFPDALPFQNGIRTEHTSVIFTLEFRLHSAPGTDPSWWLSSS